MRLLQVIPRSGLLVAGHREPGARPDPAAGPLPGRDVRARRTAPTGGRPTCGRAGRRRASGSSARGRTLGEFALPLARRAQRQERARRARGRRPRRVPRRRALREALAAFQGVKRRLELRGEAAASPSTTTSRTTRPPWRRRSQALRAPGRRGRLVAVFEPRSYTSRTRVFQDDFARAFAAADRVYVAAAHLPGKVPEARAALGIRPRGGDRPGGRGGGLPADRGRDRGCPDRRAAAGRSGGRSSQTEASEASTTSSCGP